MIDLQRQLDKLSFFVVGCPTETEGFGQAGIFPEVFTYSKVIVRVRAETDDFSSQLLVTEPSISLPVMGLTT